MSLIVRTLSYREAKKFQKLKNEEKIEELWEMLQDKLVELEEEEHDRASQRERERWLGVWDTIQFSFDKHRSAVEKLKHEMTKRWGFMSDEEEEEKIKRRVEFRKFETEKFKEFLKSLQEKKEKCSCCK